MLHRLVRGGGWECSRCCRTRAAHQTYLGESPRCQQGWHQTLRPWFFSFCYWGNCRHAASGRVSGRVLPVPLCASRACAFQASFSPCMPCCNHALGTQISSRLCGWVVVVRGQGSECCGRCGAGCGPPARAGAARFPKERTGCKHGERTRTCTVGTVQYGVQWLLGQGGDAAVALAQYVCVVLRSVPNEQTAVVWVLQRVKHAAGAGLSCYSAARAVMWSLQHHLGGQGSVTSGLHHSHCLHQHCLPCRREPQWCRCLHPRSACQPDRHS